MLRSMPPVTTASNSPSTSPSIDASIAAIADAQAASTTKFGPRRLKRFATRPARQLPSSPGIVSSVTGGSRSKLACSSPAIAARIGLGQRGEARRALELAGDLGERDAQRGEVVLLARHRVAEHDGGALEVDRTLRPAVVGQRHARAGDGPLLRVVHGVGRPAAGSAGASRAGPTRSRAPSRRSSSTSARSALRVGVVVERRVPARGVDVVDAVAAVGDVVPEGVGVGASGRIAPTPTMATACSAGVRHARRLRP